MTRGADPMSHTAVIAYAYGFATAGGVRLADDAALREIEAALRETKVIRFAGVRVSGRRVP